MKKTVMIMVLALLSFSGCGTKVTSPIYHFKCLKPPPKIKIVVRNDNKELLKLYAESFKAKVEFHNSEVENYYFARTGKRYKCVNGKLKEVK